MEEIFHISQHKLEEIVTKAFEAGKQRGIYEVIELNYTYDFDVDPAPLTLDDYLQTKKYF